MFNIQTITHRNEVILYVDCSTIEDHIPRISHLEEEVEYLKNQPDNSVLELANFTNIQVDIDFINQNKKIGKTIRKQKVKKIAVFGLTASQTMFVETYKLFTNQKNVKVFKSEEEAKDWLVE